MVNGSTWTLAKPIAFSLHRPVAGARLGLGPGEPLPDLGRQALDDVPGIMVVGERLIAQRGDLRIGDDRRWQLGDRLLRESGSGGREKEGGKKGSVHGQRPKEGRAPSHPRQSIKFDALVDQSRRIWSPSGGWNRSVRSGNLAWRRPYLLAGDLEAGAEQVGPRALARASG